MYKRMNVKDLKDGMILYEDILSERGTLLVNKGVPIDARVVECLKLNHIVMVRVLKETTSDEDGIITHLDTVRKSDKFKAFEQDYELVYDTMESQFQEVIRRDKEFDTSLMIGQLNQILSNSGNSTEFFDLLHSMKMKDNTIYMHCLNTALICNVLGHWLKLCEEDRNDLSLAGLFHDIGLLMVPADILRKRKEERTVFEYKELQTHCVYGYRYLMKRELNRQIGLSALSHHERMDGSGYPLQCMGGALCDFSRIVAIASAYDERTLLEDGTRNPFEIIHEFEMEGLSKFDPRYLMVFLEGIMDTFIGSDVLLSNGQMGRIIYINKDNLARPVVKVGDNYISLKDESSITIKKII